jgi:hypothetical protein
MQIVPYKADHLLQLALQEAQAYMGAWITPEYAESLVPHPSFTGIDNGVVVGCAGIIEIWPGRATAWALLSPDLNRKMIKVHRSVERFLGMCGVRRIETSVDAGFEDGHRWIEMLGFKLEAPVMSAYRPDGGDCSLYARVM